MRQRRSDKTRREAPTRGRPVTIDGWQITPLKTPWLGPTMSLTAALDAHVPPLSAGQVFVVSEKVAVMLTGRALPIDDYQPGRLARLLVKRVKPRPGSRGISVPEKMEYIIRRVGAPRVLLASAAAAITRPFGVRGAFYAVAGPVARDLDGGRPPFEHLLFPPLSRDDAREVCGTAAAHLRAPAVIADLNDYGGTIRARSNDAPSIDTLLRVMRTNPLGQKDNRTPFAVLTPPDAGGAS